MKLERVDITGFKSFGEKVELSFHEGMTAIVGPNGCGKSNISDAIGWVLGEQSAKSLRGQKMEDVIFNGSQNRAPMSLAQVDLRVSNVNLTPRDDSDKKSARGEVVITRRLDRSGGSEYLIDGVLSRLRDVQELFMGTGVGSRAYAIIEQGKIGLILSSKPTDRRMLIEEAAGITKYKSRRRAAELKLQAAQQNLFRVNDIVYEITRQMNSLKRQAGKARRYRRLRDALDRLDRVVAVKRAKTLGEKLAATRARLTKVADEELRRSTSLATTEVFLERARLAESEQEVALSDTKERLHQLELGIERLDQTIERDKQQRVELDARMEQLDVEARDLEARRGPVAERLEAREQEKSELTRELEGRESEAAEKQGLLKQAALSLAEMESAIEERRSEIVHRISKIAALHNFLQGVLANADKVSAELLKLDGEAREVGIERQRLDQATGEVGRELESRRGEAETLSRERRELESHGGALREELEALDEAMATEKEKLSGLVARLASLQELVAARAHFGVGARLILTRGAERGMQVLGSVSDAIEVEEKLERAAESFFDTALQRVHVRDESDVEKARALLADDPDAGRSELQVESLSGHRNGDLRPALETLRARGVPGLLGRLSDGVRSVTSSERPLLPDAIVMETYEDALRAFRETPAPYVTLHGEVLMPPGIVILGPGGAGEGLLATRREIRELEVAVGAAREGLDRSRERRAGLSSRFEEASRELEGLRERQHDLDKLLVGVEHRASQLDEERARVGRKSEVVTSERERLVSERASLAAKKQEMEDSLETEETRKSDADAALEALRGQLSKRRNGVEDLQATAADAQSRLAALRERRDALELDVQRLREGVSELTSRVEAHRREQATLVERKAALAEAVVRAESELETALASRVQAVERGSVLETQLGRSRVRVETTESALKLRRRELQEIRERRGGEEIALAKVESDLEHLRADFEASHRMSLVEVSALLSPPEMQRDDGEMALELAELKRKLDAIGPVNPMADEEYRELENRHEFVTRQRQDLLDSIAGTETAIGRIDRTSRQRFREAFDAINQEFGVTFRQLFGGGGAGLRLVDETDLLESGIDIIAQPPGKKLQNVLLLSGGEKAMTAIALLFAIFRYRPSPFCLLDEVDAPLDDANVGRFLSMLRELRGTTQFIVITHNRKTMEMADQLYGVTMEEPGISKLVSVSFVEGRPRLEQAVAT